MSNSVVEHYQGLRGSFLTVSLSLVCWVLSSHLCLMITRWLQQFQASHPQKIGQRSIPIGKRSKKRGDVSCFVFLSKNEQNFPKIPPSRLPLRFQWPSLDHIHPPKPTTDKRNEITNCLGVGGILSLNTWPQKVILEGEMDLVR